jgi:hypothetical protein
MNTNVIAKSKMDGVESADAVNAAGGRGRSKGV